MLASTKLLSPDAGLRLLSLTRHQTADRESLAHSPLCRCWDGLSLGRKLSVDYTVWCAAGQKTAGRPTSDSWASTAHLLTLPSSPLRLLPAGSYFEPLCEDFHPSCTVPCASCLETLIGILEFQAWTSAVDSVHRATSASSPASHRRSRYLAVDSLRHLLNCS